MVSSNVPEKFPTEGAWTVTAGPWYARSVLNGWRQLAGSRRRVVVGVLGVAVLAIITALAFFLDLGRPALWDPGEGRYAETVREMLLTRNWIVPTLNFAPYYDKPPGFYWLVASMFTLLGPSAWAARLPSAFGAAATIVITAAFAWRRIGRTAALSAGAVLATAILFVIIGRSVRMDTLLTLGVAGTLFWAYRVLEADGEAAPDARPRTWPMYAFAALGVIVKGPVAVVLPGLILGTYAVVTGEYGRLRRLRPGVGGLIAIVVASGWYVAAAIEAPIYLWTFLWSHNFGRYVEGATGHTKPFWYFFWMLPVAFLPWSLFLPDALRHAARRIRRGHDVDLFLVVWSAVVLVFFTCSRAKLATYVLPAFPPLALLVAAYLTRLVRAPRAAQARALRIPGLVWAAGSGVAAIATAVAVGVGYPRYAPHAASALLLLPFSAAGFYAIRNRRWRAVPALVLAAALGAQLLFYRVGAPVVDDFSSLRTPPRPRPRAPRGRSRLRVQDQRLLVQLLRRPPADSAVRSPKAARPRLTTASPPRCSPRRGTSATIQARLTQPVCIWWQGASDRC